MLWVRTKMNFGPNYITNHNLRASKLLGIEFDFWLEYIRKMVEFHDAGKILFRARREEGDYGIQDTVFDSTESYAEYFEYVEGARVEEAIINKGYDFIKIETAVDNLEDVIYERPITDSYIMLIAPGYERLLADGDL